MKILLTNDDGVGAPGLSALFEELSLEHEITVVAPATEKSGVGHGISLRGPLLAWPIKGQPYSGMAVEGTPADCVKLALGNFPSHGPAPGQTSATEMPNGGLLDFVPDLVVSGINRGSNLGIHVLYSGTTAAAREAGLRRLPSMAFSLMTKDKGTPDFSPAASIARKLLSHLPELAGQGETFLNINVPPLPLEDIKGLRFTSQATCIMEDTYELGALPEERRDDSPPGRLCFWPKWTLNTLEEPTQESDLSAVLGGYISLTPMRFEQTHNKELERLKALDFHLCP